MSTDPKYSINNPHENQRFAGEIITLNDKTTATFTTESIADFEESLTPLSYTPCGYASSMEVKVYGTNPPDRYTAPLSVLSLAMHPRLQLLLNANKRPMSLPEFEELFRRLRSGLCMNGRELLLKSRDLKIQKKLTIDQKKDRQGNFSYSMQMESGIEDWTPPEEVRIRVPAFNFIDDEIELPFDFSLYLKAVEDGKEARQEVLFKIECLDIEEHLLNGRRDIILKNMKDRGIRCLWGGLKINVGDDSWSLVHNHAEGLERLR